MSTIGPSSQAAISALGGVQAQHSASKARDKDKADATSRRPARDDQVELRVAGLETDAAVRALPQNTSEQEREEREGRNQPQRKPQASKPGDAPHVDFKA